MTIDEHITTVKALAALIQRSAQNNTSLAHWGPKLGSLVEFLGEQKRLATPIPKSLGDISDLPEALLRELSGTKTDELEDQILTVMRACGSVVNLDQMLVGLYRKFDVVQTRRYLQNKLYRMWKKELVHSVPGQRASYSLEPQTAPAKPKKGNSTYGDSPPSRTPRDDLDDDIPF